MTLCVWYYALRKFRVEWRNVRRLLASCGITSCALGAGFNVFSPEMTPRAAVAMGLSMWIIALPVLSLGAAFIYGRFRPITPKAGDGKQIKKPEKIQIKLSKDAWPGGKDWK